MKKVILATGGTGGHIYPAIAVAEALKDKDVEALFVGCDNRMEKDLIPEAGYRFIGLNIYPPKSIRTIILYIKAIYQSFKIIKREKPDAIIGFGNYISVPIVLAGIILRKKVYLQEQNVNLGNANKLFYKFANLTFLAFDKTYDDIPLKYSHKIKVTGNPLREEITTLSYREERQKKKIDSNEKILLIMGGSLGAKEINDSILRNWEKFISEKNLTLYWGTGNNNFDEIIQNLSEKKENYSIKPYFNDILPIMAMSDLIICRAGALTISELIELERPAIIIPYSSKKVGQQDNAEVLSDINASLVYDNSQIEEAIEDALELLKNQDELSKMSVRIRALKHRNAAKNITETLDIWRS